MYTSTIPFIVFPEEIYQVVAVHTFQPPSPASLRMHPIKTKCLLLTSAYLLLHPPAAMCCFGGPGLNNEDTGSQYPRKKISLHPLLPPFTPWGGGDLSGWPIRTASSRNKLASLLKSQRHEYLIGAGMAEGVGRGWGNGRLSAEVWHNDGFLSYWARQEGRTLYTHTHLADPQERGLHLQTIPSSIHSLPLPTLMHTHWSWNGSNQHHWIRTNIRDECCFLGEWEGEGILWAVEQGWTEKEKCSGDNELFKKCHSSGGATKSLKKQWWMCCDFTTIEDKDE